MNFDDPREVRLRALEMALTVTELNDEGRTIMPCPIKLLVLLVIAEGIAAFISDGSPEDEDGLPEDGSAQ